MAKTEKRIDNDEYEVIMVKAYYNKRAKKLMVAAAYGLKAFPLRVRRKQV